MTGPYQSPPVVAEPLDASLFLLIARLRADEGRQPTWDEMLAEVGAGRSTTLQRLRALRDAGLIAWEPGRHGTLRPTVTLLHPPHSIESDRP